MKKIYISLLCLAFVNVACSKDKAITNPDVEENKEENPKEGETSVSDKEAKIVSFFQASLNGKNESFSEKQSLKVSEIEETQKLVWEYWKKANQNFSEEGLGMLSPLASVVASSWKLPESLEPNAIMPFYWASKGSQPEKGYPLFLYLHGSGSKHDEWSNGKILAQRFDDAPSAYFIPQIPNEGNYYRWWQKSKQFAWEKLLRLAFLSGKINANRVYFFGISEGGYGSQRLASFYADYLAGAGPMAGGEPLINAPVENCRNIAFSLRTGSLDNMFHRNQLTQYTKEAFEKFRNENPDAFVHNVEVIPGYGHSIDYNPTTPWLKQYERNPQPKKIIWEDFEMDGIYRKGFYNIVVKERPNGNRLRYTMDISNNVIAINVDEVTYIPIEISSVWNFPMKYGKTFAPAQHGKFLIYLSDKLVDFDKEITVQVNGKQVFKGIVTPDLEHIVNSCAVFFDPERLFSGAVEIAF